MKAGLAELEQWCYDATEEVSSSCGVFSHPRAVKCIVSSIDNYIFPQYAGSAWDELKHIRQAVGFLVSLVLFLLC